MTMISINTEMRKRQHTPAAIIANRVAAKRETSSNEVGGGRWVGVGLAERLAELTEAAITSRSLARQYLRTARRFVGAARQARRGPASAYYEAHLQEARRAHEQARKCLSFARLCQSRAECLAIIGDYPISNGG
jgi:hypothetical protein